MRNGVYYIYLVPLLASALFSLRAFRLNWPLAYRWFSVFLFCSLIVETTAILWKDYLFLHETRWWHYSANNTWLYNGWFLPHYLFYMVFYRTQLESSYARKAIPFAMTAFALFALSDFLWIQGPLNANNYTLVAACMIMILLSAGYMAELLLRKKTVNLSRDPMVWISIGLFFFHLGCLPFFTWFNTLVLRNMASAFTFLSIVVTLNVIMYSLFSTAFYAKNISDY